MKLETKVVILALAFVAVWGIFLFNGPARLVAILTLSIAGWQVGTWSYALAKKALANE